MIRTTTWHAFAEAAPEMARLGAALLDHHGIAYIATTRADGSPRLHPVSPFFVDDWLVVATPRTSPKMRNQLRDPRVVIHMMPGKDDAEFCIRARARPITDPAERARVRALGPHFVREDDAYFDYRIEEVHTARWVNVGQPGTYPIRQSWRAS